MARVRRGNRKLLRRKKILKLAKGFFGTRKSNYRTAKEAVERALSYSYRDRRNKKRDFRKLWTIRLNAAVREQDINYSRFISGLKKADIKLNRKMLANLAATEPDTFREIVNKAKAHI
jgi:large subunit ribosomal protein L20